MPRSSASMRTISRASKQGRKPRQACSACRPKRARPFQTLRRRPARLPPLSEKWNPLKASISSSNTLLQMDAPRWRPQPIPARRHSHAPKTEVGLRASFPRPCFPAIFRKVVVIISVPRGIIQPQMALTSGTRLGPHEILSAIGAGGMGEVYRARDTRLDRIVAIKVLPTHLASRPELRERFEREARTVAGLNHPHICTLHDIGQQDGTDFLVMEFLEGETLAQRLLKGPLPLEQVLQYAIEISDALDKAHRKGVTHRDLKPGNIMLTKSGTKLLDFGLAKLKQEAAPANVNLSELPTASDPLTAQGTIVGTMQYMAPEQLEGKEVDARTDIFAFGA